MGIMNSREGISGRWAALSRADRMLLVESLVALCATRVVVLLLPFRRVARALGQVGAEGPAETLPGQRDTARRIGWAVTAVARRVPLDAPCLTQAIAAWWMLKRRHIPGTVYFGVGSAPGRQGRPAFHAWLRCGSIFPTGGDGQGFKTLTTFCGEAARDA
jgi:hypothetical protein